MKKAVISIILILPFLLIVVISIAGRIYDNQNYIPVSSVFFVNDSNEELAPNYKLNIEMNKPYELKYKILPSNATNTNVSFSSSNNAMIAVSKNGVLNPIVANESVTITIEIENMKAYINVEALAYGISFEHNNMILVQNETKILNLFVKPNSYTPNVEWFSSDESVVKINSETNNNAQIFGLGKGSATITAKTTDNKYVAVCNITVSGNLKVWFIRQEDETSREIITNALDLLSTITYNNDVNLDDIMFSIEKSSSNVNVVIENNRVLKFNNVNNGYAIIRVSYKNEVGYDTFKFLYSKPL